MLTSAPAVGLSAAPRSVTALPLVPATVSAPREAATLAAMTTPLSQPRPPAASAATVRQHLAEALGDRSAGDPATLAPRAVAQPATLAAAMVAATRMLLVPALPARAGLAASVAIHRLRRRRGQAERQHNGARDSETPDHRLLLKK